MLQCRHGMLVAQGMAAEEVTLEGAVRLLAEKTARVGSRAGAARSRGRKPAEDREGDVARSKAGRRGRPKKGGVGAGVKDAATVGSALNGAGPEHAGSAAVTNQTVDGAGSTTGARKRGRPRKTLGAV